jgi:hypothetical protein
MMLRRAKGIVTGFPSKRRQLEDPWNAVSAAPGLRTSFGRDERLWLYAHGRRFVTTTTTSSATTSRSWLSRTGKSVALNSPFLSHTFAHLRKTLSSLFFGGA